MVAVDPKIESSWKAQLQAEFQKPYFGELKSFLLQEKREGKTVYPPGPQIFSAFNHCSFDNLKLVILGQDPYYGPGQAHGLCFSVQKGVRPPPSLVNIFKEIQEDCGMPIPNHGNLESWARQGILLLNSCLTVRAGQPASHANRGWEQFTDAVIECIDSQKKEIVFLLWGSYAQRKGEKIDSWKHHVLKAPHPSPFSVHRGFFGCRHFSKANEYLEKTGQAPIDWSLSNEG